VVEVGGVEGREKRRKVSGEREGERKKEDKDEDEDEENERVKKDFPLSLLSPLLPGRSCRRPTPWWRASPCP
jgi:hypothetical protein